MTKTRLQKSLVGVIAVGALAVTAFGASAQAAAAGGLRNCVDVAEKQINQVGCYEKVWVDDHEVRMTFSNLSFSGAAPKDLDAFYVLAAQTDTPQGAPPNTFAHDHVIRDVPTQNGGSYSVKLQGYFVLCSGEGIASGDCVVTWTAPGGPDVLPFATTVNGRPLTSAAAIESAADAGLVVLVNLGPTAVIVGSVSGH